MYPRINYEMTENDLKVIINACQPTPCILIGNYTPSSPQENANRAWQNLGKKMGFEWDTVQPISGKGNRFFSAIPSENETQREERLKKEAETARQNKIIAIKKEIEKLTLELEAL